MNNTCGLRKSAGGWQRTFRHPDRMVRFTWWVAAFTFCLACVGLVQAWAFIQSERSFLSISAARFDGPAVLPENAFKVVFEIRNSGRSTAQVTDFRYGFTSVLGPKPNYGASAGASVALPPVVAQGTINATTDPKNAAGQRLVPEQGLVELMKAGNLRFSVFGYIDYEDDFTFWSPRRTGFCFDFNPKGVNSVFNTCAERAYTFAR